MNSTSSSFDFTSIANWVTGAAVGLITLGVLYRLMKAYFANSGDHGKAPSMETQSKVYLSHVGDAAIVIAIVVAARALVGFFAGWISDGIGTFM